MKKILGIIFTIAILVSLAIPSVVLAGGEDVVDVNWAGTGAVGVNANTTDSQFQFGSTGSHIEGSFTCTDKNDNPYNYGVDTNSSYVKSYVENGETWYQADRFTSKSSMYGAGGQRIYSYVDINGGYGEMATGVGTNYAELKSCTYSKPKTTNGYNYEASATDFTIQQWIGRSNDLTNDWAAFTSTGTGYAGINSMSSESRGNGSILLGDGCGCYTNANAFLSGAGMFTYEAVGSNGIKTPADTGVEIPGDSSFGSCSYQTNIGYAGTFTIPDFSLKVR